LSCSALFGACRATACGQPAEQPPLPACLFCGSATAVILNAHDDVGLSRFGGMIMEPAHEQYETDHMVRAAAKVASSCTVRRRHTGLAITTHVLRVSLLTTPTPRCLLAPASVRRQMVVLGEFLQEVGAPEMRTCELGHVTATWRAVVGDDDEEGLEEEEEEEKEEDALDLAGW
jgi:hypothetical protein